MESKVKPAISNIQNNYGMNSQPPILFSISESEIDVDPGDVQTQATKMPSSVGFPTDSRNRGLLTSPHRPVSSKPVGSSFFGGGDRVLVVLTIVAVVVAFIALLIGGIGLSRRGDVFVNVSSGSSESSEVSSLDATQGDGRVWTFAIGNYGSRLEYIDTATGEVRGYNVDIVNAVCRIAEKDCQFIWDLYDRCWESRAGQSPRAGVGLLGKWYDACTAWAATYERERTFAFTDELSKQHLSVFMVKMGTAPNSFNWRDLTGKKIGFLQTYVEDENCLKRYPEITGATLASDQIVYFTTQQELLSAVNNNQVDAVFLNEFLEVSTHLQVASEKLNRCAISGMAIMTRKDSELSTWWNPAFESLVSSPEYRQICLGLTDVNVHGNIPGPRVDQQCIGF